LGSYSKKFIDTLIWPKIKGWGLERRSSMNDQNKLLEKLIRDREEFLRAYPHLRPLQDYIDQKLDMAGSDPAKRMEVIYHLLSEFMRNGADLQEEVDELSKKLDTLVAKFLKESA